MNNEKLSIELVNQVNKVRKEKNWSKKSAYPASIKKLVVEAINQGMR